MSTDAWTKRIEIEGVPFQSGKPWYERKDGAYVWWCRDQSYSNPDNPRCRMWTAYAPDGRYLHKADPRTEFHIPRKWNSAEAAMSALDREIPCKSSHG